MAAPALAPCLHRWARALHHDHGWGQSAGAHWRGGAHHRGLRRGGDTGSGRTGFVHGNRRDGFPDGGGGALDRRRRCVDDREEDVRGTLGFGRHDGWRHQFVLGSAHVDAQRGLGFGWRGGSNDSWFYRSSADRRRGRFDGFWGSRLGCGWSWR